MSYRAARSSASVTSWSCGLHYATARALALLSVVILPCSHSAVEVPRNADSPLSKARPSGSCPEGRRELLASSASVTWGWVVSSVSTSARWMVNPRSWHPARLDSGGSRDPDSPHVPRCLTAGALQAGPSPRRWGARRRARHLVATSFTRATTLGWARRVRRGNLGPSTVPS